MREMKAPCSRKQLIAANHGSFQLFLLNGAIRFLARTLLRPSFVGALLLLL
jgi:hypothetical protein